MSTSSHAIAIRVIDAPKVEAQGRAKILLMKLDHIGDFITAIDAFRIVRQAFADAEITLMCLPSIVGLAKSTELFDRVVGFNAMFDSAQFGKVPKMDIEDQIAQFTDLLDGHYFVAADFKHEPGTRHWLDHVDATYIAGFVAQTKRGLDIILPSMEWGAPAMSIGQKNQPLAADLRLTMLAHAIVETVRTPYSDAALFGTIKDAIEDRNFAAIKNADRFKIGLSVGAGSALKQWPLDYWTKLIEALAKKHNALFVFFGGASDQEETQAITSTMLTDSYINLVRNIPLVHIPAYMNMLDGYIGCDTGLTHLAAKIGKPTINVFAGTGAASVWRTRGAKVKTVYAEVVCAPCHLRFKKDCPNNNVCMNAIIPGIVYDCFEKLVGKTAGAS